MDTWGLGSVLLSDEDFVHLVMGKADSWSVLECQQLSHRQQHCSLVWYQLKLDNCLLGGLPHSSYSLSYSYTSSQYTPTFPTTEQTNADGYFLSTVYSLYSFFVPSKIDPQEKSIDSHGGKAAFYRFQTTHIFTICQ
jgi:hypothetical protein